LSTSRASDRTLKRRFYSSFFLACDASLLHVEFALDPATRFIGNPAIAQQLVDVFPLGSDLSSAATKAISSPSDVGLGQAPRTVLVSRHAWTYKLDKAA
jgi:hypothetical protein